MYLAGVLDGRRGAEPCDRAGLSPLLKGKRYSVSWSFQLSYLFHTENVAMALQTRADLAAPSSDHSLQQSQLRSKVAKARRNLGMPWKCNAHQNIRDAVGQESFMVRLLSGLGARTADRATAAPMPIVN
jgi:hypothetical protein